MKRYDFVPLTTFEEMPVEKMKRASAEFYASLKRRRSVREFSTRTIPREIIDNCIKAAGTAPSGANMQPWHFAVVSDPDLKSRIRDQAEKVESEFYEKRAPDYWLQALEPLGTNAQKPYLEDAPYLIVIFSQRHTLLPDGEVMKHYYVSESVGIATGMLITAIHLSGLACLTHTPSPMHFLRDLLGRPKHELPFLILAVGYPGEGVKVPDISKKQLDEIATFF